MTTTTATPFDYAEAYDAKGWQVLALPPRAKKEPESGFTGGRARRSTLADWERWRRQGRENIGLHADEWLGVDVDQYNGKVGGLSLKALEAELGELPPTWTSTSRTDGVSGIRFFRVPGGHKWETIPATHIEIVQASHRYAMVWPSIHPEGRVYRWVRPDGSDAASGEIPSPDDLPALPEAWIERLRKGTGKASTGSEASSQPETRLSSKDVQAWLDALPRGERCKYVESLYPDVIAAASRELGSAHDSTLTTMLKLLRAGDTGHVGVYELLEECRGAFIDTVRDRASASEAAREFNSMLDGGIKMVLAAPDPLRSGRGCDCGDAAQSGPYLVDEDAFWQRSPNLQHIHDFAVSRLVSPWSVLGATLARILAAVPPRVTLPGIIGGRASLNLFVALVGAPGVGKGGSMRVSEEVLGQYWQDAYRQATPGTGQGITHAYGRWDKKSGLVVYHDPPNVFFTLDEIDALAAHASQQAATILETMRRGFMGERLGHTYADVTRRVEVPAHWYRMCLVAGVQPERAGVLINDAGGGTPQRFLWMPATYKGLDASKVADVKPLAWTFPDKALARVTEVSVCDTARREVVEAHIAKMNEQADALDGHRLLVQLKVAVALALLDGHVAVDDTVWETAAELMRVSDATRARVLDALRGADERREKGYAKRLAVREEETERRAFLQMQGQIVKHIQRRSCDGGCRKRCVTQAVASRLRDLVPMDDVIADAVARKLIATAGEGRWVPVEGA